MLGALGVVVFLGAVWAASADRRAVDWRCVASGLGLQFVLGLFVLKTEAGVRLFEWIGARVEALLGYTREGSAMVFGDAIVKEQSLGFVFAFEVLPTVIFISAFFTLLYHWGVLQFIVKIMAWVMMRLMKVSGAESLSTAANVFMGHTEAPLIIKPYLEKLTRSELLTLMVGGMATISGGIMAAYIGMGIDARALITASVMAAPGAMVIAKMLYPEKEEPLTRGVVKVEVEKTSVNFVDALAQGAGDGMKLAINIAAMLIAFLAAVALLDGLLGEVGTRFFGVDDLSMSSIFGGLFYPVSLLIGIPAEWASDVASLLGTKLVLNEFVAYDALLKLQAVGDVPERVSFLTTFALCGFANIGAVGIQLGGIGALAPGRRQDLAAFAFRALFGGFLASLLNASIASMLI